MASALPKNLSVWMPLTTSSAISNIKPWTSPKPSRVTQCYMDIMNIEQPELILFRVKSIIIFSIFPIWFPTSLEAGQRCEPGERGCTSRAEDSSAAGWLSGCWLSQPRRRAMARGAWCSCQNGPWRMAAGPPPGTSAPAALARGPSQSLLHQLREIRCECDTAIQLL